MCLRSIKTIPVYSAQNIRESQEEEDQKNQEATKQKEKTTGEHIKPELGSSEKPPTREFQVVLPPPGTPPRVTSTAPPSSSPSVCAPSRTSPYIQPKIFGKAKKKKD